MSGQKRGRGAGPHTNLRDAAVEPATFVAESRCSSRKLAEVARGSRTDVVVKFENDSSGGFGVDLDVKLLATQR